MARFIVIAMVCGLGCADAPVIEVETPLFVFNSYPANGATLAVGDLGELSFTFSEDLGAPADVEAATASLVVLESRTGALILGPPRYDPESFTLSLTVDAAGLTPGGHVATLDRALTGASGRGLPTDFVVQFQLTSD